MRVIFIILILLVVNSIFAQKVEVTGQLKVSLIPNSTDPTDYMLVTDPFGNVLQKLAPGDKQNFIVSAKGDTVRLTNSSSYIIVPGSSVRLLPTVTDGSGNTYKPVKAGQIILLQPSLATKFNDGTPIPKITANADWLAATGPAYCYYNNDSITYHSYGPLYNGYVKDAALNGGKNICPVGYHVMKLAEYRLLGDIPASSLQDTTFTTWNWNNQNATQFRTNSIGTGLRGTGFRQFSTGGFQAGKLVFLTWLKDIINQTGQWENVTYYNNNYPNSLKGGFNILCVKD
jgi:hypothetical protein